MSFVTRTMRRWRWVIAFAAAALTGLAYAGQMASAAEPTGPAPEFSAVDLADAVMFNDGPAAKFLTELERPDLEWTDDMLRGKQAIDAAIAEDDQWGRSFAQRMQSGDPNEITKALDDLATLSRQAMNDLLGKKEVDEAIDAAGGGSAGRALVWHTWVFVYRYLFWVRYVVAFWTPDLKAVDANWRLPDELTVKTIAENLSIQG